MVMQDVCPQSETCSTVKYFELLRSQWLDIINIWVIGRVVRKEKCFEQIASYAIYIQTISAKL